MLQARFNPQENTRADHLDREGIPKVARYNDGARKEGHRLEHLLQAGERAGGRAGTGRRGGEGRSSRGQVSGGHNVA